MSSDEILVPIFVYHEYEKCFFKCEGCGEILYSVTKAQFYKSSKYKNPPPHTVTDCLKTIAKRVRI